MLRLELEKIMEIDWIAKKIERKTKEFFYKVLLRSLVEYETIVE